MMEIKDYDRILEFLKNLIKEKLYCEDSELFSHCMKYDVVDFMMKEDKKFMEELFKDLEYDGEV